MLRFAFVLALAVGLLPAAQVMTGGCVVDTRPAVVTEAHARGHTLDSHELLQNPGFETGSLEPWESVNWVVTTTYPRSGTYCACVVGNRNITQWVDTTPGSEIQSVTFWCRQPDQPAAQAYSFHYSDGSSGEFTHFPPDTWQQFDVTSNLNRSKNLVGVRFWGYSGGGPDPDSTYLDDVSILVTDIHDVAVTEITWPRDTISLDSTCTPVCRVANVGNMAELVQTVMTIEHLGRLSPYYTDTAEVNVNPGDTVDVSFGPFQPDSALPHEVTAWTTLAGDTNRHNDTLRQSFWVYGGVALAERRPAATRAEVGATVLTAASLRSLMSNRGCSVRDASGRLALTPRTGIYFVRAAGLVRKVVVTR